MVEAKGNIDSVKEELGWLKVLFAVLAAADASVIAWISQNYVRADRAVFTLASLSAITVTALLLWMNYAAYRKIRELKSLS
jgi:sugar phosphate permease